MTSSAPAAGVVAASRGHVAIVLPAYLEAILSGRKTVESRLSRMRCPPFGLIGPGDVVWFRARGGGYGARAVAARVEHHENLTPAGVARLRDRHAEAVAADDAYWHAKASARYATFIYLSCVEAATQGPRTPPAWGRGWLLAGPPASHP